MTNREVFLKELSKLDNRELAGVMCQISGCDDCPANGEKSYCHGIEAVVDWMGKEEKDDLTD